MKIEEIYQIGLKIGIENDIKKVSGDYEVYPDSNVIYSLGKEIKKLAAGIDIGCFEIFLAKEMGCDAVLAHHPLSKSLNLMPEAVMQQIDNLETLGISRQDIKNTIEESAEKIRRQTIGENFYREEQLAKLLGIELLNLHTAADNAIVGRLKELIEKEGCVTLGDFIKAVSKLKEFEMAEEKGQKPFIANGEEKGNLEKISFSEFLGGEESSSSIFAKMRKAGVETVIVPHLSEEFFSEAVKAGLNVIYCGHMATDSLGMNLILDKLEEKGIEILPLGGILR
jgi:putative NIF3 family GTP cyclohydrolase 1 type 2